MIDSTRKFSNNPGGLLAKLFIEEINNHFNDEWVQESFQSLETQTFYREWVFFNSFMMFQGVSSHFKGSQEGFSILDEFHQECGNYFIEVKVFNNFSTYLRILLIRYNSYTEALKNTKDPGSIYWISKKFCQFCRNDKDCITTHAFSKWFTHCTIANKKLIGKIT